MLSKLTRQRPNRRLGLTFGLKLSLLYTMVFVVASSGLFLVAYYLIDGLIESHEREVVRDQLAEYRAWFREGGVNALKARFEERTFTTRHAFFLRVVGTGNDVLFIGFPPGQGNIDLSALKGAAEAGKPFWLLLHGKDKRTAWTVASIPLKENVTLQVGKDSTQAQQILGYFRWVFLGFMAPILLFGLLGGWFVT